jgi:hypothetical protein
MSCRRLLLVLVCASTRLFLAPILFGQPPEFATIRIPRVTAPPKIDDFLTMEPSPEWQGKLAKVQGFRQRVPSDGAAVTERTEAYFGYDDKNLYVIFVCFDRDPKQVRARMSRREDVFDDDFVELMLDTFHDQRHAYAFFSNPLGVQADAFFTEGPDPDVSFDMSFDTVWNSAGRLTDRGYVTWMAIPFRSLRFASSDPQTWGIMLVRELPRKNEKAYWPQNSSRILGRLNQAGQATGMEKISPGRNIQLIPYAIGRSFKEIDQNNPSDVFYSQRAAFGQAGPGRETGAQRQVRH